MIRAGSCDFEGYRQKNLRPQHHPLYDGSYGCAVEGGLCV